MQLPIAGSILVTALSLAACVAEPTPEADGDLDTAASALTINPCKTSLCPGLVQPGQNLVVWAVTSDNYAIYQDGDALYATGLYAGAPRQLVAALHGNTPFVQTSGKVVFIWTQSSATQPAPVSPLIVWTSRGGATLASQSSVLATLGVAASRDGARVFFIDNATSDGTRGDLVLAAPDGSDRWVAASQVNVDFNHQFQPGDCHPLLGFGGMGSSDPIAAYCRAGATTASLVRWRGHDQVVLRTDLVAPPMWSVDSSGALLETTVENAHTATLGFPGGTGTPVVIENGVSRIVEQADAVPTWSFLSNDGEVAAAVLDPGGASYSIRTMAWQGPGQWTPPHTIATMTGTGYIAWSPHDATLTASSLDSTPIDVVHELVFEPASAGGLATLAKVNLDTGVLTSLDPTPEVAFSGPVTGPWAYSVTYDVQSNNAFVMHADNNFIGNLAFGSGTVIATHLPLFADNMSFLANGNYDATNYNLSTADIAVVNLGVRGAVPTTLVAQAHVNYFASHGGTGVVFTSDHEARPGLYVRRAVAQSGGS